MDLPRAEKQYPQFEDDYLYTPVDSRLMDILTRLKHQHGTWKALCEAARISTRQLRAVRRGRYKCIGIGVVDRVLTNADSVHSVEDLIWYTPQQLVEMGMWEPMKDLSTYKKQLAEEAA